MAVRFFFLLFLLLPLSGKAQTKADSLANKAFGYYFFMPVEFPVIENTGFRNGLRAAGLPDNRHPTASVGVGFQSHVNRSILSISYAKGTRKKEEDGFINEMEYRALSFSYGYDLTKNSFYSLYPYLGFKGSGLNYLYREKAPADASFKDYLQTELKYRDTYNSRGHLDLGLGLSGQSFVLVNARLGYLVPLEKSRWYINKDTQLPHAPGAIYRFYFSLNFGIGTMYHE